MLRSRNRGFTLVELMVALVLGLIVSGAVVVFVVSILKSNRQTILTTRLNQELRATLSVVANDLRRARSVTDPLTTAKAVGGNPYALVNTTTAECIIFAYDDAINGPWHVIKRSGNKIVLQGATTAPANCSPAGTPAELGSDQVEVTALTFTPSANDGTTRKFDISITGRLVSEDAEINNISRTLTQSVYIRSVGVGNL